MCTCIVVHALDRHVGAGAASHWHDSLAFRCAITIDGESQECEVSARADHASERGVPFPAALKSELNIGAARLVVNVDALARVACRHACEELSLPEDAQLDCRPECAQFAYMFNSCMC